MTVQGDCGDVSSALRGILYGVQLHRTGCIQFRLAIVQLYTVVNQSGAKKPNWILSQPTTSRSVLVCSDLLRIHQVYVCH